MRYILPQRSARQTAQLSWQQCRRIPTRSNAQRTSCCSTAPSLPKPSRIGTFCTSPCSQGDPPLFNGCGPRIIVTPEPPTLPKQFKYRSKKRTL
eukprot:4541739-Amphidinium_carterae.2